MSDPDTSRSLKILMIACVPFFSPRGTPISIKSRLQTLSHLGHKVDLITYHTGEDIEIPGIKVLRIINIPFIKEVPVGPSFIKMFLDVFVFFKTLRYLLMRKYDLIHTHEEGSYFGALLSKVFKIRHLYDFHSSLPQAMKNFGYSRYRALIRFLEFLEKRVVNSSHSIITISAELDAYVKKINSNTPTIIIENHQSYDFYNVDNNQLGSFENSHPEFSGKNIVLYAGTFERYQGLDLLLAAAEKLIKENNNIIFILAGGQPKQIDKLQKLTESIGISSNVHFTGILPFDKLALYMKIANILVSTRTTGNNPPLKIYDYLQAGKPIVATNINAHTQILNDDMAVLVDPVPESIAQGITSLLDNTSYAKKLSLNSRKFFETNYSIEETTKRTKQILDAVMQQNL